MFVSVSKVARDRQGSSRVQIAPPPLNKRSASKRRSALMLRRSLETAEPKCQRSIIRCFASAVAGALRLDLRVFDLAEVVGRELDVGRGDVLLEPV